jgi:hypothetical protein
MADHTVSRARSPWGKNRHDRRDDPAALEALAERERRLAADNRSPVERLLGDPDFLRSALAQKARHR